MDILSSSNIMIILRHVKAHTCDDDDDEEEDEDDVLITDHHDKNENYFADINAKNAAQIIIEDDDIEPFGYLSLKAAQNSIKKDINIHINNKLQRYCEDVTHNLWGFGIIKRNKKIIRSERRMMNKKMSTVINGLRTGHFNTMAYNKRFNSSHHHHEGVCQECINGTHQETTRHLLIGCDKSEVENLYNEINEIYYNYGKDDEGNGIDYSFDTNESNNPMILMEKYLFPYINIKKYLSFDEWNRNPWDYKDYKLLVDTNGRNFINLKIQLNGKIRMDIFNVIIKHLKHWNRI